MIRTNLRIALTWLAVPLALLVYVFTMEATL